MNGATEPSDQRIETAAAAFLEIIRPFQIIVDHALLALSPLVGGGVIEKIAALLNSPDLLTNSQTASDRIRGQQ